MLGVVTVYEAALVSGLRFPLARPIREVLARLNLNPAQIMPNGWKILVGCAVIWKAVTNEHLTADEFLHCYRVVESSQGWFYFLARAKEFSLVEGCHSSVKHWKENFFFMYGDGWEFCPWETEEDKSIRCPLGWGRPSEKAKAQPELSDAQMERILLVQSYPNRHFSILITAKSLAEHMLGPQASLKALELEYSDIAVADFVSSGEMKFNKEAYKGKGRKSFGSDPRPTKGINIISSGPLREDAPAEVREVDPITLQGPEVAPTQGSEQPTGEASHSLSLPSIQPNARVTLESSPLANIVDDSALAIKRMEGIITPADLARAHEVSATRLAKNIAHDLAKVMLWSAELGTRYLSSNRSYLQETKKNGHLLAQVSTLEEELARVRAEARAASLERDQALTARDEALQSFASLSSALAAEAKLKDLSNQRAEELAKQLEALRGRIEEEKVQGIKDFKESDQAQDWLAEAFQDGFNDAKSEVLKLYPELDLSGVMFIGESSLGVS